MGVALEQAEKLAHQEKAFFSEEKKQKTFVILCARQPGHVRQVAKVFWFL
jgi:hypothetical protein